MDRDVDWRDRVLVLDQVAEVGVPLFADRCLERNWSKLGKSAFISIDVGTERVPRQRFVISRSLRLMEPEADQASGSALTKKFTVDDARDCLAWLEPTIEKFRFNEFWPP